MKTTLINTVLFVLLLTSCRLPDNPRVLLVGDSWAQILCVHNSLDREIRAFGHRKDRAECLQTTVSGSKASDWAENDNLRKLERFISSNSRMNNIILIVGGNDVKSKWHKDMSPEEEMELYVPLERDLDRIITRLLSIRRQVRIMILGYDYPNFEALPSYSPLRPYVSLYQRMGEPTPSELNQALVRYGEYLVDIVSKYPRVEFLSVLGLMQSQFGLPSYGMGADEFFPPSAEYPVGGNPDYPSPEKAMLGFENYQLIDPYHLGNRGNRAYARFMMESFLDDWLRQ